MPSSPIRTGTTTMLFAIRVDLDHWRQLRASSLARLDTPEPLLAEILQSFRQQKLPEPHKSLDNWKIVATSADSICTRLPSFPLDIA